MNTETVRFEDVWAKYSKSLLRVTSEDDLGLLSDFLKEFAREQLVEFDMSKKGAKLLEARFPLEGKSWDQAIEFVGLALMNSIRVYDIRYITNNIKLKVVDGHLEMSMMAVFNEEMPV